MTSPKSRIVKEALKPCLDGSSSLAFGFYPRHINLTLLRDGQPIAEQALNTRQLLPNGDGTYQLRKSLEVSTEELRERRNYTCTASYLSLDNKLDVNWVPECEADRSVYPVSSTDNAAGFMNVLLVPLNSGIDHNGTFGAVEICENKRCSDKSHN
uniref:Immunoglobulin C1-set domain-containing protein n=1 Tax=Oncorhynchus kisutch TaxID=8019 RepID=A0A8C7CLB3_ONCKI